LKRTIAGNGIETNAINVFKRNGLRAVVICVNHYILI